MLGREGVFLGDGDPDVGEGFGETSSAFAMNAFLAVSLSLSHVVPPLAGSAFLLRAVRISSEPSTSVLNVITASLVFGRLLERRVDGMAFLAHLRALLEQRNDMPAAALTTSTAGSRDSKSRPVAWGDRLGIQVEIRRTADAPGRGPETECRTTGTFFQSETRDQDIQLTAWPPVTGADHLQGRVEPARRGGVRPVAAVEATGTRSLSNGTN